MSIKCMWLIFVIYWLLSVSLVLGTDFHGVSVGISAYPPPNALPPDCVWDAEDMEIQLVNHQNWSDSNIDLILDVEATKTHINDAIGAMPRSGGHTDLFFFSGHGGYSGLFTVDEQYYSPSNLQGRFGSSYKQYSSFLDACHTGVFTDYMTKGVISAACRANEYAYCGGPNGHSVFTAYLCQGLTGSADSDGIVSAEDLHAYAAPRTTNYQPNMHPQLKDNYPGVLNFKPPITSGTLIDDENWSGTHTLTGNVTVPNGMTLVIDNGATVNLNNNYYIKCEGSGKIQKNGSVSNYQSYAKEGSYYKGFFPSSTTVQQMVDWASSGWDIYLAAATYSGNIAMENGVDVIGAGKNSTIISGRIDFNPITQKTYLKNLTANSEIAVVESGSNAEIQSVKIKNRLYLQDNSSATVLDDLSAQNNGYIHAEYSDAYLYGFTTTSSYTNGILGSGYSSLWSSDNSQIEQKTYAVNAEYGSYISLAEFDFCYNTYDVRSVNNSQVIAQPLGTWSACPPPYITQSGGTFTYGNCTPCGGAAMVAGQIIEEPGIAEYQNTLSMYHDLQNTLQKEYAEGKNTTPKSHRAEYDVIINKLQKIITDFEEYPAAAFALTRLVNCYWQLEEPESVVKLLTSKSENSSLRPIARKLQIGSCLKQKDYTGALKLADAIGEDYQDDDTAIEMLIRKGLIYRFYLKDIEKAKAQFNEILKKYPENSLSWHAAEELRYLGEGGYFAGTAEPEPTELKVQNYPNPFNPETQIQYSLPQSGKTSIKIFDVQGREVITLIDEDQPAGQHTIKWNGFDNNGLKVASGMYFYRINFNGKILTNKMMVIR